MLHHLISRRALALAVPLFAASAAWMAPTTPAMTSAAPSDDAAPSAAAFIPDRAFFYAEAPGLSALLEEGLEHPFVERVLGSAIGRTLLAKSEFTPEQILAWGQLMLGTPVLETLATLSARGACFALTAEDDQPGLLIVLQSADPDALERTLERLIELGDKKTSGQREPRRVSGAHLWDLDNDNVMARRGSVFVFSNSEALASEALSLAASSSLAEGRSYRELVARAGTGTLRGFIDLDALRTIDPQKFSWLDEASGQPAVQALLGPGFSALGSGSALSFELELLADGLVLDLLGADLDIPTALNPALDPGEFECPPRLPDTGQVAQALVYRDFAGFLRERVELFDAEHLPGIAEGLNGFSLFFGGKDFGDEVVTRISPWIRLISRDVEYRDGATPSIPWPGLALIAELEDAERLGPEWMAAFQSVIGVINVDSAQKGVRTNMLLSLGLEGDVQISSARYLPPASEESVDAIYNLEPACAVVGDSLVLGTHVDLVRSVVRMLSADEIGGGKEDGSPAGRIAEHVEVSGRRLAEYISRNLDMLVTQKVIDEGLSFDKAQEEVEGLRLLLASLQSLQLELSYDSPSTLHASLRVRLAGGQEDAR